MSVSDLYRELQSLSLDLMSASFPANPMSADADTAARDAVGRDLYDRFTEAWIAAETRWKLRVLADHLLEVILPLLINESVNDLLRAEADEVGRGGDLANLRRLRRIAQALHGAEVVADVVSGFDELVASTEHERSPVRSGPGAGNTCGLAGIVQEATDIAPGVGDAAGAGSAAPAAPSEGGAR